MPRSGELAILGGTPVIAPADVERVHGRYPPVGRREVEAVGSAIHEGVLWGTWGPRVTALEAAFRHRVGRRYAIAVNSGTAALHLALAGLELSPGDEVVVPAYGFIATPAAAMMTNAVPRFCDVDASTGMPSPDQVEAAFTDRTRAIVAVHLYGGSADLDRVEDWKRNGIALIEDCAQSFGGYPGGIPSGGTGDASAFSLNATKVLAGPEGGILCTDDSVINEAANRLRVFGASNHESGRVERNSESLGYNYRTNELAAAFALARLEVFDEESVIRNENSSLLRTALEEATWLETHQPTLVGHVDSMLLGLVSSAVNEHSSGVEKVRNFVLAALQAEGCWWWTWDEGVLPGYGVFSHLNHGGPPWSISPCREHRSMSYSPADYPGALTHARSAFITQSHFPPNGVDLMALYADAIIKVDSCLQDAFRQWVRS